MKRLIFCLISSAFIQLGLFPETVFASAWTLEPKKGQIIVTSAFSDADTLLDSEGKRSEIQNFSKTESRVYLELGVLPSIMLVGQAAYQDISFQGAGSDVNFSGFGETKLALQYRLKEYNGFASSVMLGYVLDGGLDDPRLNLGGPNNEVEARLLYGRSKALEKDDPFNWVWFYDVQLGGRYDLKSNIVSRRQLDVTAGIKPNEKWMLLSQVFALDIEGQLSQGFEVPSLQQVKAELSIAYKFRKNQYVQFGVLQTLAGRNVVKEQGLFAGLWQPF